MVVVTYFFHFFFFFFFYEGKGILILLLSLRYLTCVLMICEFEDCSEPLFERKNMLVLFFRADPHLRGKQTRLDKNVHLYHSDEGILI